MKRIISLVCLLFACVPCIQAQTVQVPAELTITWVLPTQTVDGAPLTGPHALTELRGWISTSPIPDATANTPTFTLTAIGTQLVRTFTAPNNSTAFVRMVACNIGGCSALSNEGSKPIKVSVPGVPTSVSVQLKIVVTPGP